jgi:fatty acid desaturase
MSTEGSTQTVQEQKPRVISWYRTPVDPAVFKSLHERSDLLGMLQSLGYLGTLMATGGTAFYSTTHWPWWVTVLIVFLHGTCFAFQINAVHELGHGTVFRTRWLNRLFERVFGFLGWINFHAFDTSHVRHHQFTLHKPDDLEVVLPLKVLIKHFWQFGFFNPLGIRWLVGNNVRIARGKFQGEWELRIFPESDPVNRWLVIRWSRIILIGHALIFVGSILAAIFVHPRFLMVPVLVNFPPLYGGWLFFSCNNTQHIGLQDNVPDFRLSCRTFTLNPVVQFLYWHMNYHTEHHMYAAVPCYRLGKLHKAIKHDMPPCPVGIIATWKEIAAIQAIQKDNPNYQHVAPVPQYATR